MTNSRIAYKVLAASIAAVVISGCSDQGQITVTLPNIQATPTATPTPSPTATPTTVVSVQPTSQPSATTVVTSQPTSQPSATTVVTSQPTSQPSATTVVTSRPTSLPTATSVVTSQPTSQPSATSVVTSQPTAQPTAIPTAQPTTAPVACDAPDFDAAVWTSYQLGDLVTYQGVVYELYEMGQQYQPPSSAYGQISWRVASDCGVAQPTVVPTSVPTTAPTTAPSATLAPTAAPTTAPTDTVTSVPSVTPTAGPTAAPTVTSVVTPTPTPVVTDLPAGSCPTSNWKSGETYQAGSEVYYQGTIFTASAYMSAGIEPQKDFVPEGQYSKPPYWITQGPVDPNWCAGLAIDTSGRVLDTSGWPHPMKRLWTDYDNASGKHIGAYFVEWGVYGRDFLMEDAPLASITHLYYAFLTIKGDNSTAISEGPANDGFANIEFEINTYDEFPLAQKGFHDSDKYPSGDGLAPGEFSGLLAEMTRAKAAHPHLKIIPSVGGWTLSRPFYEMASTAQNRKIFVDSVDRFLRTYATTFDGVDLDWEFPGVAGNDPDLGCYVEGHVNCANEARKADYRNFTLLAQELRVMLDDLSAEYGKPFELHAAVAPSPRALEGLEWAELGMYFDGINFMTYDYAGGWSNVVGHQTSLEYPILSEVKMKDGSTLVYDDWNVKGGVGIALRGGFPANKVSVGVGSYGRGWDGVPNDGLGGALSVNKAVPTAEAWVPESEVAYSLGGIAAGNVAAWEPGIVDYAYARQNWMSGPTTGANGYQYYYDAEHGAAWLYNPNNERFVSFDSVDSVKAKGEWVKEAGLGGLFMWEIDADSGELLNAMNESLGNQPE